MQVLDSFQRSIFKIYDNLKIFFNSWGNLYWKNWIDLTYLKETTLPEKSIEDNLEDIAQELQKLISLLNSVKGFNSFLVQTPEQYEKRMKK